MNVVVQVVTNDGKALYKCITTDARLCDFEFYIIKKSVTGNRFLATLGSDGEGRHGTVSIEWHALSQAMLFKVSTKPTWNPHLIAGDVVDYLLARQRRHLDIINVIPWVETSK